MINTHTHMSIYPSLYTYSSLVWLVWFLCLMAYQLFLGYLMPKIILLEEQ